MNFRMPAKPTTIDIDLTPLINIVFLMLIFFMLVGTLSQGDIIEAAEMDNASVIEDEFLVIVLTLEGELIVEGRITDRQSLTSLLEINENVAGKIAIKPDARLAADQLLILTEQLRESGVAEITLIVETP